MKKLLALSLIFFLFPYALSASAPQLGSVTYQQANATYNNASAYVQLINESGFLVFYPHLNTSYYYLNESAAQLNKSPSLSVYYSQKAKDSAAAAYGSFDAYRDASLFVLAASLAVLIFLMHHYMSPLRQRARGRQRKP